MECTIRWGGQGGMRFVAETGSGHRIDIDGPPEAGGNNQGARPMELVLAGAGSCSAFDVVWILQKGRQDVVDCQVRVKATRADTDPKVFTHIHLHYLVTGRNLKADVVERAVALSKERYCSATVMLSKTATISSEITVIEAT